MKATDSIQVLSRPEDACRERGAARHFDLLSNMGPRAEGARTRPLALIREDVYHGRTR